MDNGHAFLPPSGASSWKHCSLWPTMNQQFPQDESEDAATGTAAHWVGWEILHDRTPQISSMTPNNRAVTDEMIEGGELLADTINNLPVHIPEKTIFGIEQRIACHSIHEQCDGTPDYWQFEASTGRLYIVDYKFGHRYIDEYWNAQGLSYLSGIIDLILKHYGWTYAQVEPFITVSFTIVQPRCYMRGEPVRTHTFKLSEVRPYWNELANAAERAMMSNPPAVVGEYCKDCPGRHACQALQLAAYDAAQTSSDRQPLQLSPSATALELKMLTRALSALEARVDGLREATIENIRKGYRVPFFKVEPGYGRTTWKIPEPQVVALGQLCGADLVKPGVITPNQAQKAGIPEALVKANSWTPSTGFKLLPALSSDAAKVFGKTEN